MTMREQEVGVFDFVLLDEITLEKFMQNLKKRYVYTGVVGLLTYRKKKFHTNTKKMQNGKD